MALLDEIGRSSYVSLTTYRKDGTAVATPVWHVRNGGELLVVSDANAGKVKRLRNNSRVEVTVCDIRGRVTPGAPSAQGEARLLDEAGTQAARALLARKYLMSRVGNWFTRLLRLRRPPVIGIAVTFRDAGAG
jgi:PPOX class probable F420-dependent enzyme